MESTSPTLGSVGEWIPPYVDRDHIQLSSRTRPSPQSTLSSTKPHTCIECCDRFIFASSEGNDQPYGVSTKTRSLSQLVGFAQRGCLFHQLLVNLLCLNIDRPPLHFATYVGVKVSLNLQQSYETQFIPHAFNQQDGRRLKWSAREQMARTQTEPFVRYKYQAASCPYRLVISVQTVSERGIILRGSDTLSFYRSANHLQPMDDGPYISRTSMIEWSKVSKRSMNFAKSWLSTCCQSHPDCCRLDDSEQGRNSQLPTRLLDVKSACVSGVIRLVEPAKFPSYFAVSYAALSYCWGDSEFLKLNLDTKGILLGGIHVNRFGKTIQDSVRICNELNIPYLWVDALCILQDDLEDKMHELSKMATYYQHGILTICAASAKSANDGFLDSMEENAYRAGPFELTFEEGAKILPTELMANRYSTKEFQRVAAHRNVNQVQLFKLHNDTPIEPLALRAWTFQEAILSRRLLIFASHQIYWCCRESYLSCGGVHSYENMSIVHPDCPGPQSTRCVCGISIKRQITPPDLVPGVFTLGQCNSMSTDAQWDMVVTRFSGRTLSLESDKLIAFSAAASYFDTLFRARWPLVQYAAGLWYSGEGPFSFIRQLLWSSENSPRARRPASFRAPTWSWASIDGQVRPFERLEMYINYKVSIAVVEVSIQPITSDIPFGAIRSARLVVQCRLRHLALMLDHENSTGNSSEEYLKITPDTQEDGTFISSNPQQIQLMEIIPYSPKAASPIGLILRRFDETSEAGHDHILSFSRLGVFRLSSALAPDVAKGFFDGCTEEVYLV